MSKVETKNFAVSPMFDAGKSQSWYRSLNSDYGPDRAYQIALPVLSEDLYSQAWELIDTQKPYKTRYFAKVINGEKKLVHESDLIFAKAFLEGFDPLGGRGFAMLKIGF